MSLLTKALPGLTTVFVSLFLFPLVANHDRRHTFYGPTVNDRQGRRICMKREVPTYPKVMQVARCPRAVHESVRL